LAKQQRIARVREARLIASKIRMQHKLITYLVEQNLLGWRPQDLLGAFPGLGTLTKLPRPQHVRFVDRRRRATAGRTKRYKE
jgi:hypothetical protein